MSKLHPKIQELTDKINTMRTEMLAESKRIFAEASRELFEQNPELESFGFHGYVPSFNDGDPCVFRCSADYPDINGESRDDIEYGDASYAHLKPVLKNVESFLSQFSEDLFEDMFSDNFEITVNRDGTIDQKSYENY